MSREATYSSSMRILELVRRLLESFYGVASFGEIRADLSISDKTLGRYVDVLEYVFGDLIQVRRGAEIGRSPAAERFLIFNRFGLESRTGYQLAPLYLSRFFMSFLEGTLLDESLTEAVSIFESAVEREPGGRNQGSFGQKFYAVSLGPKSYAEHDATIETLLKALIRQNPVEIDYRKPGGEAARTYRLDPLTMIIYKQGLYIVGAAPGWEKPRSFAVERIHACRRLAQEQFSYPADYSPQKFYAGSFGIFVDEEVEVVIRFSADVAAEYITARRWHPSQVVTPLPDGGLELRMRVNGAQEVVSWVLGFGARAEVIAPQSLRAVLARESREMARTYQG